MKRIWLLISLLSAAALAQTAKPALKGPAAGWAAALTNGILAQLSTTSQTNDGEMDYTFSVTSPGQYAVVAQVNAPGHQASSLLVNIDAKPREPEMIWDVPATTDYEYRFVAWRGTNTQTKVHLSPKYFNLAAGKHLLVIKQRPPGVHVANVFLHQRPTPPTITISRSPSSQTNLHVSGQ